METTQETSDAFFRPVFGISCKKFQFCLFFLASIEGLIQTSFSPSPSPFIVVSNYPSSKIPLLSNLYFPFLLPRFGFLVKSRGPMMTQGALWSVTIESVGERGENVSRMDWGENERKGSRTNQVTNCCTNCNTFPPSFVVLFVTLWDSLFNHSFSKPLEWKGEKSIEGKGSFEFKSHLDFKIGFETASKRKSQSASRKRSVTNGAPNWIVTLKSRTNLNVSSFSNSILCFVKRLTGSSFTGLTNIHLENWFDLWNYMVLNSKYGEEGKYLKRCVVCNVEREEEQEVDTNCCPLSLL